MCTTLELNTVHLFRPQCLRLSTVQNNAYLSNRTFFHLFCVCIEFCTSLDQCMREHPCAAQTDLGTRWGCTASNLATLFEMGTTALKQAGSFKMVLTCTCICYVQSSDSEHLRISLRKLWINALSYNQRIAHTIVRFSCANCRT